MSFSDVRRYTTCLISSNDTDLEGGFTIRNNSITKTYVILSFGISPLQKVADGFKDFGESVYPFKMA